MDVARIAVRCIGAFIYLLTMTRLSGKRVVSQATPFDFVVALIVGDCIDDFVARRAAALARERLDLERWVDHQVDDRVGPILARRDAISAARSSPSSDGG